jgi:5-methylthioribose kinase
MMLKNSKISILIFTSILIGIYICIVIKKYTVLYIVPSISFEINPFEIFSLILNIFLAYYIAKTLTKEHDARKSEKELLINYFLEYKVEFTNKVSELSEQENFDTVISNAKFKILRSKIHSIIGLAKESNLIEVSEPILNEITENISEIWELFTETPKIASSKSSLAVKADIEKIRLEKLSKIELSNIKLEKLIFQLVLKINNK